MQTIFHKLISCCIFVTPGWRCAHNQLERSTFLRYFTTFLIIIICPFEIKLNYMCLSVCHFISMAIIHDLFFYTIVDVIHHVEKIRLQRVFEMSKVFGSFFLPCPEYMQVHYSCFNEIILQLTSLLDDGAKRCVLPTFDNQPSLMADGQVNYQ